jgi:hypothetical protein
MNLDEHGLDRETGHYHGPQYVGEDRPFYWRPGQRYTPSAPYTAGNSYAGLVVLIAPGFSLLALLYHIFS